MARTSKEIQIYSQGLKVGVALGVTAERIKFRSAAPVTVTVSEVQHRGNVLAAINPWPSLKGKYRDDPSWDGFDDFLRDYQQQMNRLYIDSET